MRLTIVEDAEGQLRSRSRVLAAADACGVTVLASVQDALDAVTVPEARIDVVVFVARADDDPAALAAADRVASVRPGVIAGVVSVGSVDALAAAHERGVAETLDFRARVQLSLPALAARETRPRPPSATVSSPAGTADLSLDGPRAGRAIRTRRLALGLTQQELAHLIGVRQATVSSWENDLTQPRARQLPDLEAALQLAAGAMDVRAPRHPAPDRSAAEPALTTSLPRPVPVRSPVPTTVDGVEQVLARLVDELRAVVAPARSDIVWPHGQQDRGADPGAPGPSDAGEPAGGDDATTSAADAAAAVHAATRALLRAATPADVVSLTADLVTELGGQVVPADVARNPVLPVDLSFGEGPAVHAVAEPVSMARLQLERWLPAFAEDARAVIAALRARSFGWGQGRLTVGGPTGP